MARILGHNNYKNRKTILRMTEWLQDCRHQWCISVFPMAAGQRDSGRGVVGCDGPLGVLWASGGVMALLSQRAPHMSYRLGSWIAMIFWALRMPFCSIYFVWISQHTRIRQYALNRPVARRSPVAPSPPSFLSVLRKYIHVHAFPLRCQFDSGNPLHQIAMGVELLWS